MDFGIGEAALLGAALGGGIGGATGGGKGALMGAGMGGLTGGLGGAAGGLGAGTIGSSLGIGAAGSGSAGSVIGPLLENGAFLSSEAGLGALTGPLMSSGAFLSSSAPGAVGGGLTGAGLLKGIDTGTKALGTATTLNSLLGGDDRPKVTPPPPNAFAASPGMNTQRGTANPAIFLVSSAKTPSPGTVAGTTPMAPPVMGGGPMTPEQIALLRKYFGIG